MAVPVARSQNCLACLRRLAQPFSTSNGSSTSIQTRSKSNVMRPRDQGVVVRLLTDIPKFGRKNAIFRIERGRMRNEWFPRAQAEYMTAMRFQQLGLSPKSDVGERDPAFIPVVHQTKKESVKFKPEKPVNVWKPEMLELAPKPKPSLATAADISRELLNNLVPEILTFYRKPIPATSSATAPSGENVPQAIFGSVSVVDVINHIRGLLALDPEGSRIALEPSHIKLKGSDKDVDRIKTLGYFEAHISLSGSKGPVVKVIEVVAAE